MAGPTTIHVIHQRPDVDDLAWQTLVNLYPPLKSRRSPGRHAEIGGCFQFCLQQGASAGCTVFANPVTTISVEPTTSLPEFILAARQEQLAWYRRLKEMTGGRKAMKRAIKQEEPLVRQLAFTGVLIIAGKHIHPSHWPDAKKPWGRKQSRGRKQGSGLGQTVLSLLPSERDGESPEQLRDLANCPVQTEHRGSRNLGLSRQSVPAQEGIPSGKKDSPEVEVVVPKEQVTVVEERLGQGKVKEEVEEVVEVKAKNVTSVNSYGVRRE